MAAVSRDRLLDLYRDTPDPWAFRTSAYEKAKFAATLRALRQRRYREILELGCGNGELARRLATRCARYVGVDAAPRALAEARSAVPDGEFAEIFLPAPLPAGSYGLIVVSEILYFLDRAGLESCAAQLTRRWPQAEILAVNYLGATGNALSGSEALAYFADAMSPHFSRREVATARHYRIDRFEPVAGALPDD